jgi:hypothetical protein
VLLASDVAGHEYPQVSHVFVNRVHDGLPVRADVVDVVIKVEDPAERLLGRGDVVAFRTEHEDRRADVAQVYGAAVGGLDPAGGKIVADKQLVDDELDLLGVQVDVPAPVALEAEIARSFGVDLRIDIILLGPKSVRRIEVSKFCTSQAPSNFPPPRSLVRAVSQLPPRRPPL